LFIIKKNDIWRSDFMGTDDNFVISEIRNFNRFYTNILGLLNQSLLDSPYSLTEVRILLEIDKIKECTANALIEKLNVDRGYMSRILNRFDADELITRKNSSYDGRALLLYLTPRGKKVLSILEEKSVNQIEGLICNLTDDAKGHLIESMHFIIETLSPGLDTTKEKS